MKRYRNFLLLVLFQVILLTLCNARSMLVITADGKCKAPSYLEKKWTEDGVSDAPLSVAVNILDADVSTESTDLTNKLFGTSFVENDIGLSLSSLALPKGDQNEDNQAVSVAMRSHFNTLVSSSGAFSAICALQLCQSLQCPVHFLVATSTPTSTAEFSDKYAFILRTLFRGFHNNFEQQVSDKQTFVMVLETKDTFSTEEEVQERENQLQEYIQSLYMDESPSQPTVKGSNSKKNDKTNDNGNKLDIRVFIVSGSPSQRVTEAVQSLLQQKKTESHPVTLPVANLPQRWSLVNKAPHLPLLSKEQQEALFVMSQSYLQCMKDLDTYFSLLQQRVFSTSEHSSRRHHNHNRIIFGFGKKIETLLQTTMQDFNSRLVATHHATHFLSERAQRVKELQTHILSTALELFQQQVVNQERATVQKLKQKLTTHFQNFNKNDATSRDTKDILRECVAEHNKIISEELENETLGLTLGEAPRQEFEQKLEKEVRDFPSSPAFKILQLKQAEKQVATASKNKKKKKSIALLQQKGLWNKVVGLLSLVKISTTLVGFLRPAGLGNLQGYVNYRSMLLGRPLDFLLGFQNDGDAPEIVGEDREQPLLRVQPKFHFDIDL